MITHDEAGHWTEDAREEIKRLWTEGKSASEIAVAMGGVSRNAALGVCQRMGLTRSEDAIRHRSTLPRAERITSEAGVSGNRWSDDDRAEVKSLWSMGKMDKEIAEQIGGVTVKAVMRLRQRMGLLQPQHGGKRPQSKPIQPFAANPVAPASIPLPPSRIEAHGLATVMTVTGGMCRWPIGDPRDDDFTFCGRRKDLGSYCMDHANIAFRRAAA